MKVLIALSGGMDSATVLSEALSRDFDVETVSFNYGSKHNAFEILCAEKLAMYYQVPHTIIDLRSVMSGFKSNLLLTGGDIPEGHYEDASMSQTVVPGRNLIFSSILAGLAESQGCQAVMLGVHAGDHAIYPDCRPQFIKRLTATIEASSDGKVTVLAPFLDGNKETILERGFELKTPYELTRTCYKAQHLSCGKCGSCQERLEAFANLGKIDPVPYDMDVQHKGMGHNEQ